MTSASKDTALRGQGRGLCVKMVACPIQSVCGSACAVGGGGGGGAGVRRGESVILTSQRETLTGQIYSVSCGQAEADCAEILMSSSLPLTESTGTQYRTAPLR